MGFLSRFLIKPIERSFTTCLRVVQVDLFSDLRAKYSSEMNREAASTLAAQVVNFLKGEEIEEIVRVSDEPLRSQIIAVLPQVARRATEKMRTDRHTREIIVATLRMTSVLMFSKHGKAWLRSAGQLRIEQLLTEFGAEFPQEITPAVYEELTASYHANKRATLAAD